MGQMYQMGQISLISAVLAVFTDGANLKKWGQIWKIGANLADFCGFAGVGQMLTNFKARRAAVDAADRMQWIGSDAVDRIG